MKVLKAPLVHLRSLVAAVVTVTELDEGLEVLGADSASDLVIGSGSGSGLLAFDAEFVHPAAPAVAVVKEAAEEIRSDEESEKVSPHISGLEEPQNSNNHCFRVAVEALDEDHSAAVSFEDVREGEVERQHSLVQVLAVAADTPSFFGSLAFVVVTIAQNSGFALGLAAHEGLSKPAPTAPANNHFLYEVQIHILDSCYHLDLILELEDHRALHDLQGQHVKKKALSFESSQMEAAARSLVPDYHLVEQRPQALGEVLQDSMPGLAFLPDLLWLLSKKTKTTKMMKKHLASVPEALLESLSQEVAVEVQIYATKPSPSSLRHQ